jgi:hypothetical protein
MATAGSRHMKIKLNVESGKLVKVVDGNGIKAKQATKAEMGRIHQSPNGFRYVGTILHTRHSPGCMYVTIGGNTYKIGVGC